MRHDLEGDTIENALFVLSGLRLNVFEQLQVYL